MVGIYLILLVDLYMEKMPIMLTTLLIALLAVYVLGNSSRSAPAPALARVRSVVRKPKPL